MDSKAAYEALTELFLSIGAGGCGAIVMGAEH
ncbi:hypothetical protein QFZ84_002911 [Pseudomonas fluorescens]